MVTGGTRGIGEAIVTRAVLGGARVAVISRSADTDAPLARHGDAVVAITADVRDPAALQSAADTVARLWGGADVLVNNAGVHRGGRIGRLTRESYLEVLDTNLTGSFSAIQSFLPLMPDGSAIVNIGAVVGLRGFPGDAAYASAKAGITGLTFALAIELAPRGITVNVVLPGFTQTDMTSGLTEKARDSILRRIPMGRAATAAEVADVVHNIAYSSYMTGAVVPVDGGLMAALGSA